MLSVVLLKTRAKSKLERKGPITSYRIESTSKEVRATTQGKKAVVRNCSKDNAGTYWHAFQCACLGIQEHRPGGGTPTVGLALQQLPLIQKLQMCPQTDLMETIPQLRVSLPKG